MSSATAPIAAPPTGAAAAIGNASRKPPPKAKQAKGGKHDRPRGGRGHGRKGGKRPATPAVEEALLAPAVVLPETSFDGESAAELAFGDVESVVVEDAGPPADDSPPSFLVNFAFHKPSWSDSSAYVITKARKGINYHPPHELLCLQRAYLEQRAFDYLETQLDVTHVIDVGGNPERHHAMPVLNPTLPGSVLRANCHSCCPEVLPEDAARRYKLERATARGKCGDYCTLLGQECVERHGPPEALLFVHSHYYFTSDDFALMLARTKLRSAIVVCHLFDGSGGRFELNEASWSRDMATGYIRMYARGNEFEYDHLPGDFVRPGRHITPAGWCLASSCIERAGDTFLLHVTCALADEGRRATTGTAPGFKTIGHASASFLVPEVLYSKCLTQVAGKPADGRNLQQLTLWMRRTQEVLEWAQSTNQARDALHVLAASVLTDARNEAGAVIRDMIYDNTGTTADINAALAFLPTTWYWRLWHFAKQYGIPVTVARATVEEVAKFIAPPLGIAMLVYESVAKGYAVAQDSTMSNGIRVGLAHALITAPVHASGFIPLPGVRPLLNVVYKTIMHSGFNLAQRRVFNQNPPSLADVLSAPRSWMRTIAGNMHSLLDDLTAVTASARQGDARGLLAAYSASSLLMPLHVLFHVTWEEALKAVWPRAGFALWALESLSHTVMAVAAYPRMPWLVATTVITKVAALAPIHMLGYVKLLPNRTQDFAAKVAVHFLWNFAVIKGGKELMARANAYDAACNMAVWLRKHPMVLGIAALAGGLLLASYAERVLVGSQLGYTADLVAARRRKWRYVATTCYKDVLPLPLSVDEHFWVVVDGVKYSGAQESIKEHVRPYSIRLTGETIVVLCHQPVKECFATPGYARCGPLVEGFLPVVPRACIHNELLAMTIRGAGPRLEYGVSETEDAIGEQLARKELTRRWQYTESNDMTEAEFLASRLPSQRAGIESDLLTQDKELFAISMHVKVEALIKPNSHESHMETIGTLDHLVPPPLCKPRHIQARQPRHQLASGPPMLKFMAALKRNCTMDDIVWVASGYDATEFGEWFWRACGCPDPAGPPATGYVVGNGDATNYDSTHGARCMGAERETMATLIADPPAAKYQHDACMDQRGRSKNGLVYGHKNVRPSGDAGTTALNCACNARHLQNGLDELGIKEGVRAAVLGDDVVIIAHEQHLEKLKLLEPFYIRHGFKYEFDWFRDVRAAEFCSGHFWPCTLEGRVVLRYGPKPGRLLCKMMACVSPDSQPDLIAWIRDRLASAEAEAMHVPVVRGLIVNGIRRFGRGTITASAQHFSVTAAQPLPAAYDMAAALYDTTVDALMELEMHLETMEWTGDIRTGATALSVQDMVEYDLGLRPRAHLA